MLCLYTNLQVFPSLICYYYCSYRECGAYQPAQFEGCDVPRLRLQDRLSIRFNAGPVTLPPFLRVGINFSFAITIPAAVINVITRPNFTFFPQFFEAPFGFRSIALFYRAVPYRRVFLLLFRQFVLMRVKSTILVASVRIKGNILAFAGSFRREVGHAAPSSVDAFAEGCLLEERIPSFLFLLSFYHRCPYITRATNSIFSAAEIGCTSTAPLSFCCKGNDRFRLFRQWN